MIRRKQIGLFGAGVVGMLMAAGSLNPARASGLYGVKSSSIVGLALVGGDCRGSFDYTTSTGGVANNQGATILGQPCFPTLSGTGPAGLTAAFSEASIFYPNQFQSSLSSSSVDLGTASLHGTVGGSQRAFSTSEFWDTLTFTIPGATDSTVTDIPFTFAGDGVLCGGSSDCGSRTAIVQFDLGGPPCNFDPAPGPGCTGGSAANWSWVDGQFTGGLGNSGLVSYDFVTNTPDTFRVDGVLHVTGANPIVGLVAELYLDGQTQDFSNTATLNFQVPGGDSFTSASRRFGLAAPEPNQLFLCGLAVVAAIRLRRR